MTPEKQFTDAANDPQIVDVTDFKVFGAVLGEILRDFRDPRLDPVLDERLDALGQVIKEDGYSLPVVQLFIGFYDGLCSVVDGPSVDGK